MHNISVTLDRKTTNIYLDPAEVKIVQEIQTAKPGFFGFLINATYLATKKAREYIGAITGAASATPATPVAARINPVFVVELLPLINKSTVVNNKLSVILSKLGLKIKNPLQQVQVMKPEKVKPAISSTPILRKILTLSGHAFDQRDTSYCGAYSTIRTVITMLDNVIKEVYDKTTDNDNTDITFNNIKIVLFDLFLYSLLQHYGSEFKESGFNINVVVEFLLYYLNNVTIEYIGQYLSELGINDEITKLFIFEIIKTYREKTNGYVPILLIYHLKERKETAEPYIIDYLKHLKKQSIMVYEHTGGHFGGDCYPHAVAVKYGGISAISDCDEDDDDDNDDDDDDDDEDNSHKRLRRGGGSKKKKPQLSSSSLNANIPSSYHTTSYKKNIIKNKNKGKKLTIKRKSAKKIAYNKRITRKLTFFTKSRQVGGEKRKELNGIYKDLINIANSWGDPPENIGYCTLSKRMCFRQDLIFYSIEYVSRDPNYSDLPIPEPFTINPSKLTPIFVGTKGTHNENYGTLYLLVSPSMYGTIKYNGHRFGKTEVERNGKKYGNPTKLITETHNRPRIEGRFGNIEVAFEWPSWCTTCVR